MLGDPPVLTLKRSFERPARAETEALQNVPTGFVVDAMRGQGALDPGIKPLWPEARVAASVVTAKCGPRDNMAVYVAMKLAQPGDALALQTGDYTGSALIGDHLAAIAKANGIAAVITDGLVRDLEGLLEVGLPVFARGLTPNSPYKQGPIEVGTTISLGGVAVNSGDVLVGDRDGVVAIPRAEVAAVILALEEVRAKEREMGERIAADPSLPGWVDELIASDRTLLLD